MEFGFVEQRAALAAKRKKTSGITMFIIGVVWFVLAFTSYSAMLPNDEEGAFMTAIFFGFMGFIFLVISLPVLLKAAKLKKCTSDLSNLVVISENTNKNDTARTINDEIAQGKVLIEVQPHKHITDFKIMLLPSYFLVCQPVITAVSLDKVYWVCACPVDTNVYINKKAVSLKGFVTGVFYGNTVAYIDAKDKSAAEEMAARFHQYIPNVMGDHNPELEKKFFKNHSEFLKVYNERKAKLK